MSTEEQLSKQLEHILAQSLQQANAPLSDTSVPEIEAKDAVRDEESFYQERLHNQHIADMESARIQREKYARWVFMLVAGWIAALFLILLAQGACPKWHQFSDKVLIALISSMTINLIGTLVIVLKYIFKSDGR